MPSDDLSALDPPARKLVEAASLAGRPIPLDVAAALIDAPPDRTLEIGERLIEAGLLETAGDSFAPSSERSASLTSIRKAYLYGELARAFSAAGYDTRAPGLLGDYLLRAGDVEAAVPLIGAAAEQGGTEDMIELIEAGVAAIEEEGVGSGELEGRLRLERGKYYQTAGWTDLAAEDFKVAVRELEGPVRVDALGFLAAIEDNRQESQTAEVYAAAGIGEATAIGEPVKAGSLMLLQARFLNRIGFPSEADTALAKGAGILQERGNAYQRFRATQNMGRIALDRGNALRAQPLLDRAFTAAEEAAGLAATAEAAVWLARAQFMHGQPSRGLESVATAMELAGATETVGPVFFGHQAHSEGAGRYGAYEEALEEADLMLELVLQQLPQWENAARYLRARALLGLCRVEQAADEVQRALDLTPAGINGWRWRLRIEGLRLQVLAEQDAEWPKEQAEDLTDELLQGQWLDIAAELMAVRARVEEDPELARQSAALALQLAIPTTAATAIEAGGLWADPVAGPVASRVKETARHVPEAWQEDWAAQPAIAAALAAPDVVNEELATAAAALQVDLDTALLAAGLADPETALSPAQRREEGLVRRSGGRARRGALLLGTAAAVVILAIGGGLLGASFLIPDQTTTTLDDAASATTVAPRVEDTPITEDLPDFFTKLYLTLGANPARNGVVEASGVHAAEGYYWKNDQSELQFQASPIALGQNVVVGAQDGQVYFMSMRTGNSTNVSPPGGSVVATAAGAVIEVANLNRFIAFVPNTDGHLYAYDAQTGVRFGEAEVLTNHTPAFERDSGRLYVGDEDGFLRAFDALTLTEVWVRPAAVEGEDAPINTAITLADRKLFYGVGEQLWQVDLGAVERNEAMMRADPATPVDDLETERKWCEASTSGPFFTPVVGGELVYAANQTDQAIYTFEADTCTTTKENIIVFDTPVSMPAVDGNVVYQPTRFGLTTFIYGTDEEVAGLVPTTTTAEAAVPDTRPSWHTGPLRTDVGLPASGPVVAKGVVYIGSRNSHVYALEIADGELNVVWKWDAGAQIINSVAVTDRVVYVATTGGEVIAIAPVAEERKAP